MFCKSEVQMTLEAKHDHDAELVFPVLVLVSLV